MEIRSVVFHRAAYDPKDFPQDKRPQFAIIGRSNVGKSSLINTILNRKGIARVSQTPGKTQAIQFYLINDKFYIVDLPGYGYAKVSKQTSASWGALARSYFESAEDLKLTFLLLDARRVPSDHDLDMRDWMDEANVAWQAVLTKVDKLSNNEVASSIRAIGETLGRETQAFIRFSKVTREGVDRLWRPIDAELQKTHT